MLNKRFGMIGDIYEIGFDIILTRTGMISLNKIIHFDRDDFQFLVKIFINT